MHTIEILVEGSQRAAHLSAHLMVAGYHEHARSLGRGRFAVATTCPARLLPSLVPAWVLRGRIIRHDVTPEPTPCLACGHQPATDGTYCGTCGPVERYYASTEQGAA